MFNTLKEILLNDIKQEVEESKKILDEITSLKNELAYHKMLIDPKKKYSFIERNFSYRKMKYKKEKQEYLRKLTEEISNRTQAEERLKQLRSLKDNEKMKAVIERYEKIKNAKNIKDLGYTFDQVISLFKEKGIPLVLDSSDTIIPNIAEFDKLDDLVLVHKTNYAPKGDTILTTGNAGATVKQQIMVGDRTINIEFPLSRQTVHFAVNGEVLSHERGNWDDSRYAIIIPMVDVPNISCFRVEDTFTNGNVDISKGYLLCPVNEVEEIKRNNPNLTVIGYKDNINLETGKECVTGLADKFVSQLGYEKKEFSHGTGGGTHWVDMGDNAKANILVEKTLHVKTIDHDDSNEGIEEEYNDAAKQFFSLINGLIQSDMDIDPQLMSRQVTSQLLIAGKLHDRNNHSMLAYDNGKFFYKTVTQLWKYGTGYGFETPSYLSNLVKSSNEGNRNNIDSALFNQNIFKQTISDDAIEYIENMKKRDGKDFNVDACLSELFIYETLKNVQKFKIEQSMQSTSAKTM